MPFPALLYGDCLKMAHIKDGENIEGKEKEARGRARSLKKSPKSTGTHTPSDSGCNLQKMQKRRVERLPYSDITQVNTDSTEISKIATDMGAKRTSATTAVRVSKEKREKVQ